MQKEKIDSQRNYNLKEIVDGELLGNGKSYYVCRNIIYKDLWMPKESQELKTTVSGDGRGTSITVKGSNLIAYLKKHGE